ncbi:tRNA (adenine(22)-N(1))-methyltransferase TrmK [Oceanobacillus massiliensis]|uniref:tRNA (adenine(22)-N(1))-methyltransferase n=1 Tax=Oceanobacillus massiliensis TaxID=1465765 RepID=UPI003018D160
MINKLKLSDRLVQVASFLPKGAFFADIGSDHAYLPCYVCLQDATARAIAGEINEGPYNSAKTTIENYNLDEQVEVRLGDGLEILNKDETDQIVIAGMGGALIRSILEDGKSKLSSTKRIIAQPNVDARNVRKWFLDNGFRLTDETILKENGHIYEILVADRKIDNSPYSDSSREKQLLFGPLLLKYRSAVFMEKWQLEYEKLTRVVAQMRNANVPDTSKIKQYERELAWIEEVINDEA